MRAAASSSAAAMAVPRGQVWAVQLFLFSLLVPLALPVGSILLMPHRLVLLVLFVPFFLMLFVLRRAGPILLADWMLLGAALWSAVAMVANHPLEVVIEPTGIHIVEFYGGYLIARVGIRSGADFRKMVRTVFVMVLLLLPFAVAESVTRRPVLLDLLPGTNTKPVDAGIRLGFRRAQTIFAHPILFGVFVSTALGLTWYALRPRWMRFPAVSIVALATICSLSTGALISFVVQSIFIGWETILKTLRRRWIVFVILAIAGYVVIDLLSNRTPFHVLVTYGSFSQGSAQGRITIWNYGVENVWANPVFGLGQRDWTRPIWLGSSVDNFWLFMTMRFGLPFIVMTLAALFLILRRVALAPLVESDDRLARAAFLVASGGLMISGGTVHFWHAMLSFAMFIFGAGVWVATDGAMRPEAPEAHSENTEAPPRSRYTRQHASGVTIGATPLE